MDNRYYLIISGGEFIGTFIVYDGPTHEDVERYRDALLVPRGVRQEWGPGVNIVDRSCWWADFHKILRRYEAARSLAR